MKIVFRNSFFLLVLISALLFSCKKERSPNASCTLNQFPLKVGNYWNYKFALHIHLYSDSDIYVYDTVHVIVLKDTMYLGRTLKKIIFYSNTSSFIGYSLSVNDADAFRTYLSEPSSNILFKMNHNNTPLSSPSIFSPMILDSVVSEILSYTSDSWTYRDGDVFKIDKEYQNSEQVITPKGNFNCCVFKWNYVRSNLGVMPLIKEYFSNEGLVKKTEQMINADFTDMDGNYIGTGDRMASYELIDYSLQ